MAPAEKPVSAENYLRVVGLIYLFIGIFIFVRRWNAPRAVHFYVFCLVSFVLYTFQYSGKLDTFDYEVYWASVVARLLAPALLLHFALVFPERTEAARRLFARLAIGYGPPLIVLPVDGCGHHFQAWAGAHRRHGSGSRGMLRPGGPERWSVSHQYRRPLRGCASNHCRLVSVSAHSCVDPGAPGSFLLPRPSGLSQ